MKNLVVLCLVVLLCTSLVAGRRRHGGGDDDDDGWGRRGGYIKTHSKHKSNMNMGHEHETGRETYRRIRRDYGEGEGDGASFKR